MNSLRNNNKGFSLVEILVALGVGSIILLGVATFMNASGNSYRVATSHATLQNETQDIMNYVTRMVQSSSDAGWKSGVFYVLQPDSLKAINSAKSKQPDYIVHYMSHDKANQKLYYRKVDVSNTNFTLATLNGLNKSSLEREENLISTKVTEFEAIVERYAAAPTPKPDGTDGTESPDSRTQSLSKVDVTLEVFNEGGHRLTKSAVRPRNLLTSKYFYQVGFMLESASASFTPPTGLLARPNGDIKIGMDGFPSLN